jgi:hypothetical protein
MYFVSQNPIAEKPPDPMPYKKLYTASNRIPLTVSVGVIGLFVAVLSASVATAQSKWVFEQYNYIRQPEESAFVPMVHFQAKNNWYGELRYNYEDAQTLSLFGGRTISGGNSLTWSFTPMAGYSIGKFTGVSAGVNNEAEWNDFYFSAQSQYSKATKTEISSFFFNWSEAGYAFSDYFYSGIAMQYTRQLKKGYLEPGIVAGLCFRNFSLPFYVFNPLKSDCYFVLGLNYEYNLKKKSK